MKNETRLENLPPPRNNLGMQHRTAIAMIAPSIAVVAIACFVTALSRPGNRLTDQEYGFARDLVRHEIRQDGAVLTSATVTMSSGRVTDSNLGYSCISGRLLHIKFIGDFPHTTTTGHPVQSGATLPDFTVHAVVLTADAETGRACLIGVQTGEVSPAKGAVSLPVK